MTGFSAARFMLTAGAIIATPPVMAQVNAFDIPAGNLKTALSAFVRQSGMQLIYRSSDVAQGVSGGVRGAQRPEAALHALLSGSGFFAHRDVSGAVAIVRAPSQPLPIKHSAVAPSASPAPSEQGAGVEPQASEASPAEIVVTGSRIIQNGSKAPTPVSVVTEEEIAKAAPVTVADYVNQLPALSGSTTPRTAGGGIGGGTAGANLLNLRNLGPNRTLVLVNGRRVTPSTITGVVDVNTLPTALVKRVDVVTGGASASYGSDAVSGVVNFILDTKFTGLKAEVQGGISDYGDASNFAAKLAAGTGFAGDRGHIIISGDYSKSGQAFIDKRGWYRGFRTFANPAFTVGNGQPARLILPNSSLNTTDYGLIGSGPLRGIAFDANGNVATTQFPFGAIESGFFQSGGTANDDNALGHVVQLLAPLETGTLYGRVSFDLTDNVTAFGELSYGDSHVSNQSGLFWRVGQATVRNDNAFLPASVVQAMAAAGVTSFPLSHNNRDIGIANGVNDRSVFRVLGGFEGSIGSSWKWDVSFQYGKTKIVNAVEQDVQPGRYNLAIDAVVNPANGQIVCRSTLTNPTNGCVPYNPFGSRPLTAAQTAYLIGYARQNLTIRQDVLEASAQGDLFSLPAGDVSLAFGGVYRKESAVGDADPVSLSSGFYVGNYKPFSGRYDVKEAFAEILVPILKDSSLGRSLSLNAAGRYTDYSTSGAVTTWKIGATYSPVDDLIFRVTRSRDIRAPNLNDLFLGGVVNTQQVNNPFRNNVNDQYLQTTSGNPDLKPEKADSLTAGIVFQPSFLRGLTLSVDYYDVKISQAISTVSGQIIINNCFAGDASYCAVIGGDPAVDVTSISVVPFNATSAQARGVDMELGYRTDIGRGSLDLRAMVNYTAKLTQTTAAAGLVSRAGEVGNNLGGGQGVPYFRALASVTYKQNPVTLQLKTRFISASKVDRELGPLDVNVEYNRVPAIVYLDAYGAFDFKLGDAAAQLFLACDNVLNTAPPVVVNNDVANAQNSGTTASVYDTIGRQYRIGVRVKL